MMRHVTLAILLSVALCERASPPADLLSDDRITANVDNYIST